MQLFNLQPPFAQLHKRPLLPGRYRQPLHGIKFLNNFEPMKLRLLLTIILIALFYSCGQNARPGKSRDSQDTIENLNSNEDTNSSIIIKDSSFYSATFLKSLKPQKAHWKFYLDSDKFVFNKIDTILFPNLLPLSKVVYLTGKNNDLEINLTVKRILISTINYNIEIIKKSNPPVIKSGSADLSPYFFVHSKTDEIDSTVYSSESIEYWDNTSDYLTTIKVSKDQDNKLLIGKVECKLNSLEITQDNCPTLKEK